MADEELDAADEANQTEEGRYEKAYRATRRALDESIELLMLLKEFELDLDERRNIGGKIIKLKRDRADLVRANLAFHAGRAVMTPPSPELAHEIVDNMNKVVELTVERATSVAVLKISAMALKKFAEIQDIAAS